MLKRVMLALLICSIALIGAVAVSAATPSQTTGANQRIAIQVAENMLGALVLYVAPRPYSERIPGAARVLDITISGGSPRPVLSRTVTRLSEVRRIAGFVNALPFLGHDSGVAFSCPDFTSGAPVDTFVFRATRAGPVLATVSEWAATPVDTSPCTLTTLRVRGHREPPLMDGGVLLHQAGSLLGVRLARS